MTAAPPNEPTGSMPPPPPGYGQQSGPDQYAGPQYGQMPPTQQAYGAQAGPPPEALAPFGLRAKSALVDWLGPGIAAGLIGAGSTPLRNLLQLLVLIWACYQGYQAGATGQSLGRKWAGTRVANVSTGQNIGGWTGVGRYLLHILDVIPVLAGYWLAPNVSRNKQTFADMIVKSVVVRV